VGGSVQTRAAALEDLLEVNMPVENLSGFTSKHTQVHN